MYIFVAMAKHGSHACEYAFEYAYDMGQISFLLYLTSRIKITLIFVLSDLKLPQIAQRLYIFCQPVYYICMYVCTYVHVSKPVRKILKTRTTLVSLRPELL